MRFGPTSLQVSSVLAKGLRRPKLRADLRISEQTIKGEDSFVIKVAETNSYNRYGPSEYELLSLCDGTRTSKDIVYEFTRRHPNEALEETELLEFLDGVEPAMWEQSLGEKNLAVLARIRDERKSRIDRSNMLYISFKAWDPDKFLTKIDPYLGWLFTPGFVVFSVALFILSLYLFVDDWTRIQTDTVALYSFTGKTAYDIWIFWVLLLALGAIHEFGHGLTCKHFGGEVHQMGFLLIYFSPAFYTDTTDILLFDRTSRRQWVIFAGMWIELVVCGLATLLWHFTTPGMIVNDLAYKTMLLSGIEGTLFNLDPLIKADGYYALSQYLGVDNLREDSFAFLKLWVQRNLLLEDVEYPPACRRHRRIYLIYGTISFIYSSLLLTLSIFFMKNILIGKLGNWGYAAYAVFIYLLVIRRFRKRYPALRNWVKSRTEAYMAWRSRHNLQFAAFGGLLLLFLPVFRTEFSAPFVLEPHLDQVLRSEVPGIVRQVHVPTGIKVFSGQILATLDNPGIEAQAQILSAKLHLVESDLRTSQSRSEPETTARFAGERERLVKELDVALREVQALQIRSHIDGVVKTSEVDQKTGKFLDAGEDFCEVVDRGRMRIRILVPDYNLELATIGAPINIKVQSFPYRTFSGQVRQILPAAALERPVANPQELRRYGQKVNNYFAVIMEFPNSDGSLIEGMTGTAKIYGKRRPLAFQMERALWRWVRSQIF